MNSIAKYRKYVQLYFFIFRYWLIITYVYNLAKNYKVMAKLSGLTIQE